MSAAVAPTGGAAARHLTMLLPATPQPPAPRQEVDWMSPNIGDGEAKHVVPLGAAHGQFAAYAAPARQQTDVTASLGGSRRKGVRVFADDP